MLIILRIMQRFVANEMYDAIVTVPKDYFKNYPEEFDRVINIMLKNETHLGYLSKLDDDYWRAIIQSSQKPPVGMHKDALMEYKNTSEFINKTLSDIQNGVIPDAKMQKTIDLITDYINTTRLEKPLKAYRDDDGFKLKGVTLPDGRDLGNTLDYLYKNRTTSSDAIKKFETYLQSVGQTYQYTNERFMSSTFVRENRFKQKEPIRWEFDVPEGTKGTFIETYNDATKKGWQIEYLMQRNTEIIIKDIEWSTEFDCWYIKADIKQK